jgi:F0F1-type ATP synthase assembly protein I
MEKKIAPAKSIYAAGPQQQFIGSVLSMSWQLAMVFLIPVVGGLELDKHFKTLPLCSLIGFAIGITAGVLVVRKSVIQMNRLTADIVPNKHIVDDDDDD